jgi:predicted small secreted protein
MQRTILVIITFLLTLWTIPYCLTNIIKGQDIQIFLTILMTQIPAYIKMIKYFWEK